MYLVPGGVPGPGGVPAQILSPCGQTHTCKNINLRNFVVDGNNEALKSGFHVTSIHSRRMRADRAVTRNKQWPSSHEADSEQNDQQAPVKTLPFFAVGNNLHPLFQRISNLKSEIPYPSSKVYSSKISYRWFKTKGIAKILTQR